MAKVAFTDAFLRSLSPRADRYTEYEKDRRYEGFVVDVLPSGKLSFRYRYRLGGRREKVTIGSYPGMSLAVARDRYRDMRDLVHKGISPALEKQKLKNRGAAQLTFAALAADWVAKVLKPANKNARQDETYLTRDIIPIIGNMVPAEIDRPALWRCIDNVRSRGHGQAARRVQSVLKRVFDYACSKGDVLSNPVRGIDPKHVARSLPRQRVLSHEEIPVWIHAIETSSMPKSYKLALRLLILIPVRKGELLSAKWSDVNFVERFWDVPKENSKNGAPIRHRLTDRMLAIFHELKLLALDSIWVLPSMRQSGRIPLSKSGINTALRGIKGLPDDVVIHDLRRTIRTNLAELGVPQNVAELCLNHRPTGITKVYDRAELIDQRYGALEKWDQCLQGVLSGGSASSPAAVVPSAVRELIEQAKTDDAIRDYVLRALLSPSKA